MDGCKRLTGGGCSLGRTGLQHNRVNYREISRYKSWTAPESPFSGKEMLTEHLRGLSGTGNIRERKDGFSIGVCCCTRSYIAVPRVVHRTTFPVSQNFVVGSAPRVVARRSHAREPTHACANTPARSVLLAWKRVLTAQSSVHPTSVRQSLFLT